VSKEQLVGALAEAHDNLLIAADGAVTRGDPHKGGWGLREVLAHVTAWEAEAMKRIPLLIQGEADVGYDVDAFNAAAVDAVAGQSLAQVHANFKATHERLLTLLNDLDEAAFKRGGAARKWVAALARHSKHHADELGAVTRS
jgi:hypothetical protein